MYLILITHCIYQHPDIVNARLCKEHFHQDDIQTTKKGMKLKRGTLPKIKDETNNADNDLQIITKEGFVFCVNKSQVAACSPYLRRMLLENQHQEITIFLPQTEFRIMRTIMNLFYGVEQVVNKKDLECLTETLSLLEFNSSCIQLTRQHQQDERSHPLPGGGAAQDRGAAGLQHDISRSTSRCRPGSSRTTVKSSGRPGFLILPRKPVSSSSASSGEDVVTEDHQEESGSGPVQEAGATPERRVPCPGQVWEDSVELSRRFITARDQYTENGERLQSKALEYKLEMFEKDIFSIK